MITRYVNTASSAGGDGTTNDTSGSHRAFVSLWEGKEWFMSNPASDHIEFLCCGVSADRGVGFGQITTDPSYYVYIKGNSNVPSGRHPGYWSDRHYRIADDLTGSFQYTLRIADSCSRVVIIDGIQIYQYADDTDKHAIMLESGLDGSTVKNCIIKSDEKSGQGINIDGEKWRVKNSIISKVGTANKAGIYSECDTVISNCVVEGFSNGIYRSSGSCKTINCSVFNNDDDFNGTMTIDHCASDDGDGTNPVSVTTWSQQFQNSNFVADVDFRLDSNSELIDQGIGPVSDSDVPQDSITSAYRHGPLCDVGPFQYSFYKARVGFGAVGTRSGLS